MRLDMEARLLFLAPAPSDPPWFGALLMALPACGVQVEELRGGPSAQDHRFVLACPTDGQVDAVRLRAHLHERLGPVGNWILTVDPRPGNDPTSDDEAGVTVVSRLSEVVGRACKRPHPLSQDRLVAVLSHGLSRTLAWITHELHRDGVTIAELEAEFGGALERARALGVGDAGRSGTGASSKAQLLARIGELRERVQRLGEAR